MSIVSQGPHNRSLQYTHFRAGFALKPGRKHMLNNVEETLDPEVGEATALAHRIVDEAIRSAQVRERRMDSMPTMYARGCRPTCRRIHTMVCGEYQESRRAVGNIHPRFWGWCMGSSNFTTGALRRFLAAVDGSSLENGNTGCGTRSDNKSSDWLKEISWVSKSASG
jgi:hypothetical protein